MRYSCLPLSLAILGNHLYHPSSGRVHCRLLRKGSHHELEEKARKRVSG